jgi:hypothetical protein
MVGMEVAEECEVSVVDPKRFIADPNPTLMSSGYGSNFQKVSHQVSDLAFFLKKYDFKGSKMTFQNIIFKEYLNLVN